MDKIKNMDKSKMTQLLVTIGGAAAILGLILPFMTASVSFMGVSQSESVTYIGEYTFKAIITLALAGASIASAWLMNQMYQKFSVGSALAFILVLWDIIDVKSEASGMSAFGAKVSVSFGGFLILLGLAAVIAGGVLSFVWKIGDNTNTNGPVPPFNGFPMQ